MEEKVYYCFKFYDKKGRRLGIKAREEGNNLIISVVTCSKEDRFKRKIARTYLDNEPHGVTVEKYKTPIIEGMGQNSFMSFLFDNFYRQITTVTRSLKFKYVK